MACGIDGSIVFPNDPNNDSTISATGTLGGIRVRWSYPSVNPQAVAFVKVFRSTSSDFLTMSQIGTAKGDTHFDALGDANAGTTFYYWIQIVSINGTSLGLVGPASATLTSSTSQYLAALSNQLDESHLATTLRTEIAAIQTNRDSILNEGVIRSALFDDVTLDLNALGIDVTGTFTAIASEQTQRIDGDTALASDISAVVAANASNLAAIVNEQTARVSADGALAGNITTLEASVETNTTDINGVPNLISAAVQDYDLAQVGYCMIGGSPTGTYGDKATCEANGGTWLQLAALAQAVKGVQINDGSGNASIEQRATVYKDELDQLQAQYSVRLNGNGSVGGFGIGLNADQNTIDAIFDVGTFAIRGAGAGDVYPFIVSNGVTYIQAARIQELTVGTIKLEGNAVTENGTTEFNSTHLLRHTVGSNARTWINRVSPSNNEIKQMASGVLNSNTGFTSGNQVVVPSFNYNQAHTEDFRCLITIDCVLGIKAQASLGNNAAYSINVKPRIKINGTGVNLVLQATGIDMSDINVQSNLCYNVPLLIPVTLTATVEVDPGANFNYNLHFDTVNSGNGLGTLTYIDSDFGAPFGTIGTIVDYIFLKDVRMSHTVILR